jgi:hypothetical protein
VSPSPYRAELSVGTARHYHLELMFRRPQYFLLLTAGLYVRGRLELLLELDALLVERKRNSLCYQRKSCSLARNRIRTSYSRVSIANMSTKRCSPQCLVV